MKKSVGGNNLSGSTLSSRHSCPVHRLIPKRPAMAIRLGYLPIAAITMVALLSPGFAESRVESITSNPIVSEAASGNSYHPLISDDGRFIFFVSSAENLTSDDGDGFVDVFRWDRQQQSMERVSRSDLDTATGAGHSIHPLISADGQVVAFDYREEDPDQLSPNSTTSTAILHDLNSGTQLRMGRGLWFPVAYEEFPEDSTHLLGATIDNSSVVALSSDGNQIAFKSLFTQDLPIAPGASVPAPGSEMAWVFDRLQATTNRLTVGWDPREHPIQPSTNLALEFRNFTASANFHRFAYETFSINQLPGGGGNYWNITAFDLPRGTNLPVSVAADDFTPGNGHSGQPSISSDGRWLAFHSEATTLTSGDSNSSFDVFLRDLETATTHLVSTNADGGQILHRRSAAPAISGDGNWLAFFSSSPDMVANDTNGIVDVFLRNIATGEIVRISDHADWNGVVATRAMPPVMTPDGSLVLFQASGSGLFLYDRLAATVRRLSSDAGWSRPAITPDGQWIAFSSKNEGIGSSDRSPWNQIYLWNRTEDAFELISKHHDEAPSLSADGPSRIVPNPHGIQDHFIVESYSGNLSMEENGQEKRYWLKSLMNGTMVSLELGSHAGIALAEEWVRGISVSDDGLHLAFEACFPLSSEPTVPQGCLVFLRDLQTEGNILLYQEPEPFPFGLRHANPRVSPDGGKVAYAAVGSDIHIYDVAAQTNRIVSSGLTANNIPFDSLVLRFSADQSRLYFRSRVDFGGEDPFVSSEWNLYRHDLILNETQWIGGLGSRYYKAIDQRELSLPASTSWLAYNIISYPAQNLAYLDAEDHSTRMELANARNPSFNFDGQWMAFESIESKTSHPNPAANPQWNVYVLNTGTRVTELISQDRSGQFSGDADSFVLGLSPDGRHVLFQSDADNLTGHTSNRHADLFVRDRFTGTTFLLSKGLSIGETGNGHSGAGTFTRDGTRILFTSLAENLADGDFNREPDVFSAVVALPDSDGDQIPDDWELTYFGNLDRDGSGDFDNDTIEDLGEYRAGTNPINNQSIFRVLKIESITGGPPSVLWPAVPGRIYRLEYKNEVTDSGWSVLDGDIAADGPMASREDPTADGHPNRFYRVQLLP